MSFFFHYLTALAEIVIIMRLCAGYLGFKKERWSFLKSALLFFLLFFIRTAALGLTGSELVGAVLMSGSAALFCFTFCGGKACEKALVCAAPFVLLFIGSTADDPPQFPYGACAEAVLKTALLIVLEVLILKRRRGKYTPTVLQSVMELCCVLISLFVVFLLWVVYGDEYRSVLILVSILVAVLNVLLRFFMHKIRRDSVIREEYMLSQMNLAAQEKLVLEARERYTEIRTLRHDMRHYLTAAAELFRSGSPDEAARYIEKVLDEKINTAAVGVSTGSAAVDAVINNRLGECSRRGIDTKFSIDTENIDSVEVDVSIVLSNLLENAIDNCGAVSPKIELFIESRKSMLYIAVRNSVSAPVLANNPTLATDKDGSHGLGLISVRRIAEKHSGSVEFRDNDGFFTAEVWLFTQ